MAVASLHFYLAPTGEAVKVGKSLVRVLRSSREVSYVVLANIATMACSRPVRIYIRAPHLLTLDRAFLSLNYQSFSSAQMIQSSFAASSWRY